MGDDFFSEDLWWFSDAVSHDDSAWATEDSMVFEVAHIGLDQAVDELFFGLQRFLRGHSQ